MKYRFHSLHPDEASPAGEESREEQLRQGWVPLQVMGGEAGILLCTPCPTYRSASLSSVGQTHGA